MSKDQLASLQLAIMRVLWDRGEASVSDVRGELAGSGRDLAYTTVATMLVKLEKKGQVTHRAEGKAFVYRPAVRQDSVSRSMVTDLAHRLFAGDVTLMVSHLLDGCDVSSAELARLKQLIQQRERQDSAEGEAHDSGEQLA